MKKLAGAWLFCLTLSMTAATALPAGELTRDEALKTAEAAIVRNGCTDLAPLKDRRKLAADQAGATFGLLRDHELHCRAMHAREGTVKGRAVWIIGFEVRHAYPEMRLDLRARLVLMRMDGSKLRLENDPGQIKRILKDNP